MKRLTVREMVEAWETIKKIAAKYGLPEPRGLESPCWICGKRGVWQHHACPDCMHELYDE